MANMGRRHWYRREAGRDVMLWGSQRREIFVSWLLSYGETGKACQRLWCVVSSRARMCSPVLPLYVVQSATFLRLHYSEL